MVIKAVVFDLGGVYFKNGTAFAIGKIEKTFGVPNQVIDRFLASEQGKEGKLYRLGKISEKEFWSRAAKCMKLGSSDIQRVREIWHSSYTPNKGMRELVRTVRKKYKVVAFSGSIPERIKYLSQKYGLGKEFDEYIYSFELGLSKRDINSHKEVVKRLGLAPSEFVFVDDQLKLLEVAEKLGIKTILFKNAAELKRDLIKIGVEID